jgi:hypothetical protein
MDKKNFMKAWHPESIRTRLAREEQRRQHLAAIELTERRQPRIRWTQTPGDQHQYVSPFDDRSVK